MRSIEEQVRVLKTAFQSNTRKVLEVQSAGMAWLVEHAADTLNKALVSSDGRTPYERVRGRKYNGLLFEFGQVVLSKIPGKQVGGIVAPRWVKGIWLGKLWATDERIVTEPGGRVVRARTVKPHVDAWDRDLFDEIQGWPSEPTGRRQSGEESGARVDTDTPQPPTARDPEPVR